MSGLAFVRLVWFWQEQEIEQDIDEK